MSITPLQLPWGKPLEFKSRYQENDAKLCIVAGPILRYWGMKDGVWKGSALYVTADGNHSYDDFPELVLNGEVVRRERIFEVFNHTFWRYMFHVKMADAPTRCTYQLGAEHPAFEFVVPGKDEDMNIMFYSCNGFSLNTQTAYFPASLWEDVMQKHEQKPFNVMLGGGDQLYCDNINIALPMFIKWRKHNVSRHGFHYRPTQQDNESLDAFYFSSYVDWYGRGYWKGAQGNTTQAEWPNALATIPSINIYDDHDIIDGYGSYKNSTMRTPVFESLGQAAHRFYMLFQLGIAPMGDNMANDSSFITINRNGPYIHFPARSIYAQLGKSTAFLGLDCRTERTKHQICTQQSYDAVFRRLESELSANPDIKHLLVMLGVPIAYPRMVWAELLMESWILKPVKWLARHGLILKGFVNPYDGEVELLDDLNDHWCARTHKQERNNFILRLQRLAQKTSTRITILAGDVHLAGVGRFRTYRKDGKYVEPETDYRLMFCPISSAITNTPPPELLADFMNKRNRNHFLGKSTVEDLVHLFSVDTDAHARNNSTLFPRRNYCTISVLTEGDGTKEAPGPEFAELRREPLLYARKAGALRVTLEVEKAQSTKESTTVTYAMNIPELKRAAAPPAPSSKIAEKQAMKESEQAEKDAPAADTTGQEAVEEVTDALNARANAANTELEPVPNQESAKLKV